MKTFYKISDFQKIKSMVYQKVKNLFLSFYLKGGNLKKT